MTLILDLHSPAIAEAMGTGAAPSEAAPHPVSFDAPPLVLQGIADDPEELRLDLLLAELGGGETIEIALSMPGPGGPPRLEIAAAATGAAAQQALAARLAILTGVGPYVFRSGKGPAVATSAHVAWLAEPAGLMLPFPGRGKPSALQAFPLGDAELVLPVPRSTARGHDLGALLPLLRQAPADIRLAVRIERNILAPQARRLMKEMAFALAAADGEFECRTTTGEVFPVDAARAEALASALRLWHRIPAGLRLTLSMTSDGVLPRELARLLGAAFFARPVHLEPPHRRPAFGRLDLRCALPGPSTLASLLPRPDALRLADVPRLFRAKAAALPTAGVLLGHLDAAASQPVRLSDADRSRHVQILGMTGSGKSTLLLNMFLQDVARGDGACLIDPHGDLFEQAMAAIPRHRLDDVVVIDPTDTDHAVGLNLLEADRDGGAAARNFAVNEMLSIFTHLYDMRVAGGPMFETYMRNAMLLLLEGGLPDASLIDVPRVFQDRVLRNAMLARCTSQLVVNFWQREALRAAGDASLENISPYITSKLNQFVGNALLRPIIGQPRSTIDFRHFMDQGKIVLMNLARGVCGELDSRLLGMVGIGKIFAAALGRVRLPAGRRRPCTLYIDECQHLLTPTMAQMLAEARKFGLRLVLANQTLSQLENGAAGMLSSVMGNVGSLLLLRLGPIDAERVEIFTRPHLGAPDLRALKDGEVAACLLVEGRPVPPFVFRSRAWAGGSDPTVAEEARALSRSRYARPVAAVEEAIARRLQPMIPTPPRRPPEDAATEIAA